MIIVSSGAASIRKQTPWNSWQSPKTQEKQGCCDTGQIRLAHAYENALTRHGITIAQILLSPDDTEQRRRRLNAATFLLFLSLNVVPIINENDTVTTKELRFGDNDRQCEFPNDER